MSTPSLPWEILDMIFRMAVYDPTSDCSPISTWDRLCTLSRFHSVLPGCESSAMKVKLSLASVSKCWRNVAIPLLYENICIDRYKSLRLLSRIARPSPFGPPSHIIHTKSLSIIIDRSTIDRRVDRDYLEHDIQCLDSIIGACENLRCLLIFDFHTQSRIKLSFDLSEAAKKRIASLLHLESDTVSAVGPSLITTLKASNSLQVWALRVGEVDPHTMESISDLTLPHLATLRILGTDAFAIDWMAGWKLPSCPTVTLKARYVRRFFTEPRVFIQAYGSKITSLDVSLTRFGPIQFLVASCSSLQHLVLAPYHMSYPSTEWSMINLDVIMQAYVYSAHNIIDSVIAVHNFIWSHYYTRPNRIPKLKRIRILDISNSEVCEVVREESALEMWWECVQKYTEMGIPLEDRNGAEFEAPS